MSHEEGTPWSKTKQSMIIKKSGHTTQCRDGTWSNFSGKGTCSGHGGIKRNKVKKKN